MKKIKIWALLGLSLLFLSSCSFPGLASNDSEETIGITGGITSESQILASLVSGMIKHYTDLDTTIINKSQSGVQSLEIGLSILDVLIDQNEPMMLKDIAQVMQMHPRDLQCLMQ